MDVNIIKSYISELKKGSHKAFNAIYDMFADRLYSFAFANTKSQEIANDIVQEVFLKLWSMRETISMDGSLQSLLFTMANHRIIDQFRKQVNRTEMELFIEYKESLRQEEDTDAETNLFYDDFVKTLKLCKELLTARQCQIYELSRESDKSIQEISEFLNLSEQTVKNQLTIALKKIKAGLLKSNILYFILFEICFIT